MKLLISISHKQKMKLSKEYWKSLFLRLLPLPLARNCTNSTSNLILDEANLNTRGKHLLVDVSVIYKQDAGTGIQRVVRNVVDELMQKPPEGYEVRLVVAGKNSDYCYANNELNVFSSVDLDQRVDCRLGDIFLGIDLAAHLLPKYEYQLLEWKQQGAKIFIFVHDLLPINQPDWFSPRMVRRFRRWMKTVAVYSNGVITNSMVTSNAVHSWMKEQGFGNMNLVSGAVHLGAEINRKKISCDNKGDCSFSPSWVKNQEKILMVGTIEPRKGYEVVLQAFDLLWNSGEDLTLIIIGKRGWKTESLQSRITTHQEFNKKLFWFENATDEYLEQSYLACDGMLIASRAEGFGLPLVEALHYGKPVLARDIPIFREVSCGYNIDFFDNDNAEHLSKKINSWLKHKKPVKRQMIRPWNQVANEIMNVIGLSR